MDDSYLILLKKQKVCAHENNLHFLPESDKIPIPTAVDQYKNYLVHPYFSELLELQKYSKPQIATDCSVFDRFCFLCVVCLF